MTPLNLYRNATNHPLLLYVFGTPDSAAAVYSSGAKEDVKFVTIAANGDYPQTKTYEYREVGEAIVLLRIVHEVIVAGSVKTTEVLCENHHIDGTLAFPLTVKSLMMDSAQTPPVVTLSRWDAQEFSVARSPASAFGLELNKHTTISGLKPECMRRALKEGGILNVGDLTASDLRPQNAPIPDAVRLIRSPVKETYSPHSKK